jgi:hypothetical protein
VCCLVKGFMCCPWHSYSVQMALFSNGNEVICVVYVFGECDLYIPLNYIVLIQLHTIRSQPVSLHRNELIYVRVRCHVSYENSRLF